MASSPFFTVLEHSQVSPPPTTVSDMSLPLTFFDILWLPKPPVNNVLLYELSITKTHFLETIVPNLKHSLSITLQHFPPHAGHLIVFPTCTRKPEIRYVQGDFVEVTFAECNINFDDITGNHPRNSDKFYQLMPRLGHCVTLPEYVKIPVFSLQITFLSNRGISIGMTTHHSLCDVSGQYCFLKAWTSIARCGTDALFLANETLPNYDRLVNYPELDELYLKRAKVLETFYKQEYQPSHLSCPTDKVRAKFVMTRTIINHLKKQVSTHLPTLPYVSSFTVACAYIWCCIAKARNDDLHFFMIPIDCRARIDPPIPKAYNNNCVLRCTFTTNTTLLRGKEGLRIAVTLLGDNLHKMLTYKDGILKYGIEMDVSDINPTSIIGVSGTPKLNFYDLDFGWGKPKKIETISIDYSQSITIDACKESPEDLEIGVSLTATEMQAFVRFFDEGIKSYV